MGSSRSARVVTDAGRAVAELDEVGLAGGRHRRPVDAGAAAQGGGGEGGGDPRRPPRPGIAVQQRASGPEHIGVGGKAVDRAQKPVFPAIEVLGPQEGRFGRLRRRRSARSNASASDREEGAPAILGRGSGQEQSRQAWSRAHPHQVQGRVGGAGVDTGDAGRRRPRRSSSIAPTGRPFPRGGSRRALQHLHGTAQRSEEGPVVGEEGLKVGGEWSPIGRRALARQVVEGPDDSRRPEVEVGESGASGRPVVGVDGPETFGRGRAVRVGDDALDSVADGHGVPAAVHERFMPIRLEEHLHA